MALAEDEFARSGVAPLPSALAALKFGHDETRIPVILIVTPVRAFLRRFSPARRYDDLG